MVPPGDTWQCLENILAVMTGWWTSHNALDSPPTTQNCGLQVNCAEGEKHIHYLIKVKLKWTFFFSESLNSSKKELQI